MSTPTNEVSHPLAKGLSVFGAWLAGMKWGDIASALAAAYTLLLIFEWFWKRFWRTFLIERGWWSSKSAYMRSDNVPFDDLPADRKP